VWFPLQLFCSGSPGPYGLYLNPSTCLPRCRVAPTRDRFDPVFRPPGLLCCYLQPLDSGFTFPLRLDRSAGSTVLALFSLVYQNSPSPQTPLQKSPAPGRGAFLHFLPLSRHVTTLHPLFCESVFFAPCTALCLYNLVCPRTRRGVTPVVCNLFLRNRSLRDSISSSTVCFYCVSLR